MQHRISEFLVGLLFGLGLILSGMTDPSKVIGFLDIFECKMTPKLFFLRERMPKFSKALAKNAFFFFFQKGH